MIESFYDFHLSPELIKALDQLGFHSPTEVQQQAIPAFLEGRDLLIQARTGAGKTAAYALPICQRCQFDHRKPQALILAPTRELADQIAREIRNFSLFRRLNCAILVGRQPMSTQKLQLKQRVQIAVGTPGRVLDHLNQGTLDLSDVKMLVLDEADQMFSLGLAETVQDILSQLPDPVQTCLCSATLTPEILELADLTLTQPVEIQTDSPNQTSSTVRCVTVRCTPKEQYSTLLGILSNIPVSSFLIFCATQLEAEQLAEDLLQDGLCAGALHGGMEQDERFSVLRKFRRGQIRILCATDVAARGLDIQGLDTILHWDLPSSSAQFIHRSGRCGRLDQRGTVISLLTSAAQERYYEALISELSMDNEPLDESAFKLNAAGLRPWKKAAESWTDKDAVLKENQRTILLRAGRQHKIRPGDIVGALCHQGLPAEAIGTLDIHERITFITLIQTDPDILLEQGFLMVKGKSRRIEPVQNPQKIEGWR